MNKYLKPCLFIVGFAYVVLAFSSESLPHGKFFFGAFSTFLQVSLDGALFYYSLVIARKTGAKSWETRLLVPAFFCLLLGDIIYGFHVNILGKSDLRGTSIEMIYNLIYMVTLTTVAAYYMLVTQKPGRFLTSIRLLVLLGVSTLVYIFFNKKLFSEDLTKLGEIIHLGCLVAKTIILSHALIGSVLFSGQFRRWFSCGFMIILSYSLLLEYLEIQNLVQPAMPTEIFWTLGLLVLLLALKKAAGPESLEDHWDDSSLVAKITFVSLTLAIIMGFSWMLLEELWRTQFPQLPHFGLYAAWFILVMVAVGIVGEYFKTVVISPMEKLSELLQHGEVSAEAVTYLGKTREFNELSQQIFRSFKLLGDEKAKNERLSTLAAHMSHDIRSPLTALRMLTSKTDNLSEENRRLMLQITARISNIAENLLSGQKSDRVQVKNDACLVYGVAETIISEKRVQLPGSRLQIELNVDELVYMSWIAMPSEAIARILSNLINNSIEAFETDPWIANPRVSVAVSKYDRSMLRISIQDNAGGIPDFVIACISSGEKFTTKQMGSGIGLSQARECLAQFGGRLELYSQSGFGSVVNVFVPIADVPSWAVSEVVVDGSKPVLILDDDDSIHSVWRNRLAGVVNLLSCNDVKKVAELTLPPGTALFVDYYLRGSTGTGLDFIASLPDSFRVCLVTSRFDEPSIQKRAMELGCKILPKYLAPFVPLRVKMSAERSDIDLVQLTSM